MSITEIARGRASRFKVTSVTSLVHVERTVLHRKPFFELARISNTSCCADSHVYVVQIYDEKEFTHTGGKSNVRAFRLMLG